MKEGVEKEKNQRKGGENFGDHTGECLKCRWAMHKSNGGGKR